MKKKKKINQKNSCEEEGFLKKKLTVGQDGSKNQPLKYYNIKMRRNTKALIFDFDGTIANTLPYTFEKIITLTQKYHIDNKKEKLIEKIRRLSPSALMKEFKIDLFKVPFVLWEIRQAQKQLFFQIDNIKPFAGIELTIKKLRENNLRLFIYSSNLKKTIERFLSKEGLKDYFEKIYVGRNLLGKDKDLLKILKEEGLEKNEVFYVADEVRDALACQKARIKMIGVVWGLAGDSGLTKTKVEYLVKKPEEILKLI